MLLLFSPKNSCCSALQHESLPVVYNVFFYLFTRTFGLYCVWAKKKALLNIAPSQWREKRDADLVRRDAISDQKKSETISKARSDIDDFYESYNRRTDKQKAETARQAEEFLQNREDTTAGGGGTSWERIAKLVDLSGKGQQGGGQGSTKNKMREILLELKADKNAPGVTGV